MPQWYSLVEHIFRKRAMNSFVYAIGLLMLSAAKLAWSIEPNTYAAETSRVIKALSAEEIHSYLAGKGAGMARAAELNHYPGPAHVLELAEALELSPAQKARTQQIFSDMQKDAIRQGENLVEQERALDREFVSNSINQKRLRARLAEIGRLQGQVRNAHLQAHLKQKALLTAQQILKYDELRGYASQDPSVGHHRHN